jgi:hypothetical protein
MHGFLKIRTRSLVLLALFGCLTSSFQANNSVIQEQAIKLAEQCVVDNGYTLLPTDKSKVSYELFDLDDDGVDNILKRRYNSLQPKAFCVSESDDRWDVGFLSTKVDASGLSSSQRQSDLRPCGNCNEKWKGNTNGSQRPFIFKVQKIVGPSSQPRRSYPQRYPFRERCANKKKEI